MMKNFYISVREIYGVYALNLIETSKKKIITNHVFHEIPVVLIQNILDRIAK